MNNTKRWKLWSGLITLFLSGILIGAVRQWLDRMWDDALAAFAAEVDREDGEEERSV